MRFFYLSCVHVYECGKPRWHGKWVELREQFVGVSSFLLLCESWGLNPGHQTPTSHLAGPWLYFEKNSPGCGDSKRTPTFTNEPATKQTQTMVGTARWGSLRSGLLPWSCQTERMHRNIVLLVGFSHEHMCVLGQDRHTNVGAGSLVSRCQRKTKAKHPATYKRCENKSYMDTEISIWIKIYFNLHLSFWIFTERHIYRWIQMCEHTSVIVERWVFLVCSPRT